MLQAQIWNSVHPESLMEIKRFSHEVQYIVSHVVGNLAPETL